MITRKPQVSLSQSPFCGFQGHLWKQDRLQADRKEEADDTSEDDQSSSEDEESECGRKKNKCKKRVKMRFGSGDEVKLDRRCCNDTSKEAILRLVKPDLPFEWALSSQTTEGSTIVLGRIAADCCGNLYVCGFFTGRVILGRFLLEREEDTPFIAKIRCDGTVVFVVVPSRITGTAAATSIAVDACGHVYVTGNFTGTLQWGGTTVLTATLGSVDVWVVKMSSRGRFLHALQSNGVTPNPGSTSPTGIDVDGNQEVYLTGSQSGRGSSALFGAFTVTAVGAVETWIAKVDCTFTRWVWTNQTVGSGTSAAISHNIKVDARGHVFVTGQFHGTVAFNPAATLTSGPNADMFLAKADTRTGTWLAAVQSTTLTMSDTVVPEDLAVDLIKGDVYVVGGFQGTARFGPTTLVNSGLGVWTFVTKLTNHLEWIFARGVPNTPPTVGVNDAIGVAVDVLGNVYVTGTYVGRSVFDSFTLLSLFQASVFIAKMSPDGRWVDVTSSVSESKDSMTIGLSITTAPQGVVYVAGSIQGSVRFGEFTLTTRRDNIFVARIQDDKAMRLHGIVTSIGCGCQQPFSCRLCGDHVLWQLQPSPRSRRRMGKSVVCRPTWPRVKRVGGFCGLVPSVDYYVDSCKNQLVMGCNLSLLCDPHVTYFGTACSSTTLLVPCRTRSNHT